MGCIEVFESRGIQVCEEAVKALKSVSCFGVLEVAILALMNIYDVCLLGNIWH